MLKALQWIWESSAAMAWSEDWVTSSWKTACPWRSTWQLPPCTWHLRTEGCGWIPAADSGIKAGDVITKLDDFALSNAQKFHELILDKAESALRHGEGMHFTVSILRPSSGFEFCATISAEVIDTSEQNMSNQNKSKENRWPVPKTKWLYPDDVRDADMMPLVRKCRRPGYVYRAPLTTDVSRYTRLWWIIKLSNLVGLVKRSLAFLGNQMWTFWFSDPYLANKRHVTYLYVWLF